MDWDGDDGWQFLDEVELQEFTVLLNTVQDRYQFQAENLRVAWQPLSFYDGYALLRIVDYSWQPAPFTFWYLGFQGELTRMEGHVESVHQANRLANLNLNPVTVLDYLKFFCFFVRADGLPFLIVESVEDLGRFDMADIAQSPLASSLIHDVRTLQHRPDNSYIMQAIVLYDRGLFDATFEIAPTGHIRMLEDTPLNFQPPAV
ncbi:MAG: hypothetical protein ACOYK8_10310 [Alphaproteobacteria bacterium]